MLREWIRKNRHKRMLRRRDEIVREYKQGYKKFENKANAGFRSTIIGGKVHPPFDYGALDALAGIDFERGVVRCLRDHGIVWHHREDFPNYKALADFIEEQSVSSGDHFMLAAQCIRLVDAYAKTETKVIYAELDAGTDEFIRFVDEKGEDYAVNRVYHEYPRKGFEYIGPLVLLSEKQNP